jgi:hypothetical protein
MDHSIETDDGTIIAITAAGLADQQQLPVGLLTFLQTYSQVAGGPVPAWEDMEKEAAVLFVNARTKHIGRMSAVDALSLYRLLDLYKEVLEAIVYDQLEKDSEPLDAPEEAVYSVIKEDLDPDLDVGYASSEDGTLCDECYQDQRRSGLPYRVIYAPEAEAHGLVCRSCDRLLVKLFVPPEGD